MRAVKLDVELEEKLAQAEREIEQKKKQAAGEIPAAAEERKDETAEPAKPAKQPQSSPVPESKEVDGANPNPEESAQKATVFGAGRWKAIAKIVDFLLDNRLLLMVLVGAMLLSSIASYYLIATGVRLIGGSSATYNAIGAVEILCGLLVPVGLVGAGYLLLAKEKDSKWFFFVPAIICGILSIVFLFVS